MDDFLYNLRTGNLRRGDTDHRQARSSAYKGPQRRSGGDRRQGDLDLQPISEQLSGIEKNLKAIANDQRRIADAAEREADTLDLIAHYLKHEMSSPASPLSADPDAEGLDPSPEISGEATPENPAVQAPTREAILTLIRDLRSRGMSYGKVAEQLEAQGIATLSGRGKWYATTVSKLIQSEEE
jgi:hypothetical protein